MLKSIDDFFSFRFMISVPFIQLVFFIGCVFIIYTGIVFDDSIFQFLKHYGKMSVNREKLVIIKIIFILGGIFLWRLICELWIVIFRIHSQLVDNSTSPDD